MAMYDWNQMYSMWMRSDLTSEQAIGQLIQWGLRFNETVAVNQREILKLKREVEALSVEVVILRQQLDKEE